MSAPRRSRRRRPGPSAMTARFGPLDQPVAGGAGQSAAPGCPGAACRERGLGHAAPNTGRSTATRSFGPPTRPICRASTRGASRPQDIAITAGCNLAFFAAMMLLARHGDAVLLPTPWYFNHQMSPRHARHRAAPAALPCRRPASCPRRGCRGADRRAACAPSSSSRPNNPTGAVYPAHVIEAFADSVPQAGYFSRHRRDLPGFSADTA